MEKNKIVLVGLLAGALVVAGLAVSRPVKVELSSNLGSSGSIRDFVNFFNAGAFNSNGKDPDFANPLLQPAQTDGANIVASSSHVCTNNIIEYGFDTVTGTLRLPSALQFEQDGRCLSDVGDTKELTLLYKGIEGGGAGTSTLAAGASSSIEFLNIDSGTASTTIYTSSTARLVGNRLTSSTEWIVWQVMVFGDK